MAILASRTLGKSGRSGYERIKPGVEVVCALVKKDFKTVNNIRMQRNAYRKMGIQLKSTSPSDRSCRHSTEIFTR
ncbi:hypothetical protein T4E_584 [Trichinella pseudospiralis]|uniref:Uncharacterized protein n=1 Tax=Trichinella pseudospiralis TaxID=6337 RepID=A0A0V0XYP0_TRIPS|nr:hypothetical protein T4E_584 [Trichinella pseudospiralis]